MVYEFFSTHRDAKRRARELEDALEQEKTTSKRLRDERDKLRTALDKATNSNDKAVARATDHARALKQTVQEQGKEIESLQKQVTKFGHKRNRDVDYAVREALHNQMKAATEKVAAELFENLKSFGRMYPGHIEKSSCNMFILPPLLIITFLFSEV